MIGSFIPLRSALRSHQISGNHTNNSYHRAMAAFNLKPSLVLLLCFAICLLTSLCAYGKTIDIVSDQVKLDPDALRETILQLQSKLSVEQTRTNDSFRPFPLRWSEQAGLYKSYIKINLYGDDVETLLRRAFKIPDMNMFVTNFVTIAMLEAYKLGTVKLDENELQAAIDAILSYKDKNHDENAPIFCFWPQRKVAGAWEADPVNLVDPINTFGSFANLTQKVLDSVGLGFLYNKAAPIVDALESMGQTFHIPADADDSSVNLALGALLKSVSQDYPSVYQSWSSRTGDNLAALFSMLKLYSFQPWRTTTNAGDVEFPDVADPRSYYFLHEFLNQIAQDAESQGDSPRLALISTWLTNVTEDVKTYPQIAMPFQTNNVDPSVNANTLYGLSHALLNVPLDQARVLFDDDLQQIYGDIVKLLVWCIQSGSVLSRPDIALMYYPSVYDFYWFVARASFYLNNKDNSNNGSLPFPVMQAAASALQQVLTQYASPQLVQLADIDTTNKFATWRDFLGGAKDHEDQIFSTALALNALLDTWTTTTTTTTTTAALMTAGNCARSFYPDTPAEVVQVIEYGVNYLQSVVLDSHEYDLSNAFFSGSVKTGSTLPFWYPGNYATYMNGTSIADIGAATEDDVSDTLIYGVDGYIDASTYEQYINNATWFGQAVPTSFPGFNTATFPFWSAPAMTYSMSILAMSKYVVVLECAAQK